MSIKAMLLILLCCLQTVGPDLHVAWYRLPVLYLVPDAQRQLQMDSGQPAKARRRSRHELLLAAWNA